MGKPRVTPILSQNACDLEAMDSGPAAALVQQRLNTMGPMSMLFYQQPLEPVRADGVWLYDADGGAYLDVYNNVPVLGHCHPAVVESVARQLSTLNTHTRYLNREMHEYSERVLDSIGVSDGRLVFTCSGSEANDLAIRLAQRVTDKTGVIVSEAAYHGNTSLVTQVSPSSYKSGTVPDWVEVLSLDQLLDQPDESKQGVAIQSVLVQLEQAIERLDQRGYGCAALLVDSVFSSDGVLTHPQGFLMPMVERVQKQGGWWIADEVQPGFGRCGESLWGFQRHRIDHGDPMPDAVTLGKPMGNGFPVAGLIASKQAFAELNQAIGYFNTFGGSHAAIAAATAVWQVLETEELPYQAMQVGHYLGDGLSHLCKSLPTAHMARGVGLFWGMDLQFGEQRGVSDTNFTSAVINHLRQQGVLIGAAGKTGNTLKIRPPLCFEKQHVDHFLEALAYSLEYTASTSGTW